MPRAKSQSREDLLDSAMKAFWHIGFHVISIGDLVRETGVSRGSIYSDFSDKRELFHACIDHYEKVVMSPLFESVEAKGAGIDGIRDFLEALLTRFKATPGAGPGCLVGNTFTQLPQKDETREKILQFYAKRTCGYRKALAYENKLSKLLTQPEIDDLANYVTISVQGLWSYSQLTEDESVLRHYSDTLIAFLELRMHGAAHSSR